MVSSRKRLLHAFLRILKGQAIDKESSVRFGRDARSLDKDSTQDDRIPPQLSRKTDDKAVSSCGIESVTEMEQVDASEEVEDDNRHSDPIIVENQRQAVEKELSVGFGGNIGSLDIGTTQEDKIPPQGTSKAADEEAGPYCTESFTKLERTPASKKVDDKHHSHSIISENSNSGNIELEANPTTGPSQMLSSFRPTVDCEPASYLPQGTELFEEVESGNMLTKRGSVEPLLTRTNKPSYLWKAESSVSVLRPALSADDLALASLLQDLEDYYEDSPGCIIPEKNKGCSSKELDIILNHEELFFAASPKRFVLKKWITDEIRRMFDARVRAPLSVSEIYDSLLQLFRTGFFSLPKLQEFLGASTLLTWRRFIVIERQVLRDYDLALSGRSEIHRTYSVEGNSSDRRERRGSGQDLTSANANVSPCPKEMPKKCSAADSALANLLQDIEEFYKNTPGCIIPEINKGCSFKALGIILRHEELFLVASPKRFVLKKWITDEIRRLFDAQARTPLNVSEIYSSLLQLFHTRFFSSARLEDFLGTSHVLTWDRFVTIENKVMHDYSLAISGQTDEARKCRSSDYDTMPIDSLGLSRRPYNCLKRGGIKTVGELLDMSEESLLKLWGLGRTSLIEIKLALKTMGLCLQGDEESIKGQCELRRDRLESQFLNTKKKKQHSEEEIDVMAAIFASFDLPTKSPDGE